MRGLLTAEMSPYLEFLDLGECELDIRNEKHKLKNGTSNRSHFGPLCIPMMMALQKMKLCTKENQMKADDRNQRMAV